MAKPTTNRADAEQAGNEVTATAATSPSLKSPAKAPLLRRFWEGWKRFGLFLGKVNLYILTFIVFWSVFAITALISKILRRDFLAIRLKKGKPSYWVPLEETERTIEKSQRQF